MNILGISGSLRQNSSNTALLRILKSFPHAEINFEIFPDLGRLPHFSPELDDSDASLQVRAFRAALSACDGVVLSTPEYAFGMPGVLKNALDWTVSSGEFGGKPVAAISASPTFAGGDKAHASLLLVLSALAAEVVPKASFPIPMIYKKISKAGEIIDPAIVDLLSGVLSELAAVVNAGKAE